MDFLLGKIQEIQSKENGLMPSQIVWKGGRKSVEDNNIFFTALSLYTLISIKESLGFEDQRIIGQIFEKAAPVFPKYKSRRGRPTYNFYPNKPEQPFPGFRSFSKLEMAKLPDDLDCTAFIRMILPASKEEDLQLKKLMVDQSKNGKSISSTLPQYRKSLAYRSWFAEKMKQDLDVVVNCNVLSFVFQKGLPLDEVDEAAIEFITTVITRNQHLTHGHLVSSYYQEPSLILYHVARLISISNHDLLKKVRDKVLQDLRSLLTRTENSMEKVILLISLARLEKGERFELDLAQIQNGMNDFFWFKTNFLCGQPLWVKKLFGKWNFLTFGNRCEAFYWSLVIELKQISGARLDLVSMKLNLD